MRMSGGVLAIFALSAALVSPVRNPIEGERCGVPSREAAAAIPASGARRFLSTSTASAFSGETYRTRQRAGRTLECVGEPPPDGGMKAGESVLRSDHPRILLSLRGSPEAHRCDDD